MPGKKLDHAEQLLIRRLNKKGYSSQEISEHLEMDGYHRAAHTIRRWLNRHGLNSKWDAQREARRIKERKPKVLTYDIETTNFKGDFGECICMGYKWNDEPVSIVKISDYRGWRRLPVEERDKYLVAEIRDIIAEADVLVGHYAKRFDHRFIQTRLLIHGLGPIPDTAHVDTWKIAKYQLACTSNRLKTLVERFDCENKKSKVNWKHWRRLLAHDQESIDIISDYCKDDVQATYDLVQKFLPIAKDIPNLNLLTGDPILLCSGCGSSKVTQRGYRHTKVHTYTRYQCQDCGRWSRGRTSTVDKNLERHMY